MPSLWEILCTLVSFLPQVFLIYFLILLIEKSGLLALVARFFHLPVKDLLPVCLSFNCTTLAICATKEHPARHRLVYLLSFIPCSAQLPLILLLLTTILHFPFWSIVVLYLVAILIGLIVLCLVPKTGTLVTAETMLLRWPNLLECLGNSLKQTLIFARKIFLAFIVSAFVVVILARFSFKFHYVSNPQESILFSICGVLSPVFRPIGLANPALICALLFGIIAKEAAISVLLFFPEIIHHLTLPVALSLLVFYTFYPKCISAQAAVCSNCNNRTSVKVFLTNLLVAYVLAFVVYNVSGFFN